MHIQPSIITIMDQGMMMDYTLIMQRTQKMLTKNNHGPGDVDGLHIDNTEDTEEKKIPPSHLI